MSAIRPCKKKQQRCSLELRVTTIFYDGNKRTAIGSCVLFLMANGSRLYFSSDEEVADFVETVATGALGHDEATEWIRNHIDTAKGQQSSLYDISL